PEVYRLPDDFVAAPEVRKQRTPSRNAARFLKGPIPWDWLDRAMRLGGKALAMGLMLWLESGLQKKRTFRFCLSRVGRGGERRHTARRAIRCLETAGLIAVVRRPGSGLDVTILDATEDQRE